MAVSARSKRSHDAVLSAAVDRAYEGLLGETPAESVGEHQGFILEADRLGTHYFTCLLPGYVGWRWAVTVARPPRARTATICEVQLLPGDGALLAAEWVPWADRLAPGDVGSTDRLPYRGDDERLEPGYTSSGDVATDEVAIVELGLDRQRVLTRGALDDAATRWYEGSHGPDTPGAKAATSDCSTCGFIVPLSGHLGKMFGVCVNEWSDDDGKVVSYDHGCGAHSETDLPRSPNLWQQPDPIINELDLEVVEAEQG